MQGTSQVLGAGSVAFGIHWEEKLLYSLVLGLQEGTTPLQVAIKRHHAWVVELLLHQCWQACQ
jgi:hypothetical protein